MCVFQGLGFHLTLVCRTGVILFCGVNKLSWQRANQPCCHAAMPPYSHTVILSYSRVTHQVLCHLDVHRCHNLRESVPKIRIDRRVVLLPPDRSLPLLAGLFAGELLELGRCLCWQEHSGKNMAHTREGCHMARTITRPLVSSFTVNSGWSLSVRSTGLPFTMRGFSSIRIEPFLPLHTTGTVFTTPSRSIVAARMLSQLRGEATTPALFECTRAQSVVVNQLEG